MSVTATESVFGLGPTEPPVAHLKLTSVSASEATEDGGGGGTQRRRAGVRRSGEKAEEGEEERRR